MTKIFLTDVHLLTIQTALEVYTRLRLGQIDIALDEAFPDYWLTWEEREDIHKFARKILFPDPPILKYDGHGGYSDQYGVNYDEGQNQIGEKDYHQKCREHRPQLSGTNSSFGIGSNKIADGNIAYELRQTIRQYLAVKKNDGFFDASLNVSFDDPLKVSSEPLPIIEGFSTKKNFPFVGKAINAKLQKLIDSKKFEEMWKVVNDYMERKHPDVLYRGYTRVIFNEEKTHYELEVEKPRKKNETIL
jgi:hypothetical protein